MQNTSLYFQALALALEFRQCYYLTRDKFYFKKAVDFLMLAKYIRQQHFKGRLP